MEEILGQYNNENFTLFNMLSNTNDGEQIKTQLHETIHLLITMQTRWGCFEYYMQHIVRLIDPSFQYIADFLHTNCLEVQEGVAELWEKLYVYKCSGKDTFLNDIHTEKFRNPNTYKYLKKMLPILKKNSLEVDQLACLIYRTAVYSMNICCVERIPVSSWQPEKLVVEFEQNKTPNIVFNEKLEELETALVAGEDAFSKFFDSLQTDWDTQELKESQVNVNKLTAYIQNICQSSTAIDSIEKYLATIKPKYAHLSELQQYIIPTTFTVYEDSFDPYNLHNPNSILLIFGNHDDCLYSLKNKLFIDIPYDTRLELVRGVHMDYIEKKRRGVCVSNSQLKKEIERSSCPLVISYKAYEHNNSLVKLLEYNRRRYYIYCDRPYITAKLTIENMCLEKHYALFEFETFHVICLEVGRYGILFIPVMNDADFLDDCKNNYFSGIIREKSSTIFKNKFDENELNLVINCLFQT